MQIHHTDFDKHLDFLSDHEGSVLFFEHKTNPARFMDTVISTVKALPSGHQCLLIVNQTVARAKKGEHLMRKVGERLEASGIATLVHAFVVPPALFSILKDEQTLEALRTELERND